MLLSVEYSDGIIRAGVDGQTYLEVYDTAIPRGKVGLMVDSGETAFDNVRVEFPRAPEPVLTYNEVFKAETTMAEWAAPQSDWLPARLVSPQRGQEGLFWHRGDFFGDIDLEARPDPGDGETWAASLLIAADEYDAVSGYRLDLTKASPLTLQLLRAGEEVATAEVPQSQTFKRFSIRRRGRFVFGCLDGTPVLHFRDDQPLSGSWIGIREQGVTLTRDDLKVYSPNVSSFTFAQAPDDWRVAAGRWELDQRWECDSRWSWFYGGNEDGLAAIWHKRHFGGDVTLEFCAAIKMDRVRGSRYEFARDMNATICSDGRSLTSGYGFLFGADGNTFTGITRNGEVVARTTEARLAASTTMHRQWLYIKIEKKGPELRYYVDNKLVLQYTDPQPLPGDRVALWTYRDQQMVSRVRVSAQDTSAVEPPDFQPPPTCQCRYDLDEKAEE